MPRAVESVPAGERDLQTDMMGKAPHSVEAGPMVASGEVRERLPAGTDIFSVTQKTRERYAIKDDEALRWVESDWWEQHTGTNRPEQFCDDNDGRIPVDKSGKPKKLKDLILAAYPQKIQDDHDLLMEMKAYDWEKQQEEVANTRMPRGAEMSDRERQQKRQEARRDLERNGYVGPSSPTSGMSLEAVYARYTDEQITKEEDRNRRGIGRRAQSRDVNPDVMADTKRGISMAVNTGEQRSHRTLNPEASREQNRANRTAASR